MLVRDRLAAAIAWRLPQRVVAWCAVRVVAYATTGAHAGTVLPELSAVEALRRWPV